MPSGGEKLEIEEGKLMRHIKNGERCEVCGKRFPFSQIQIAHRIPKGYKKIFGPEVIHHELNTVLTCAKCNQSVLLKPSTRPVEVQKLLDKIRWEIVERMR